MNKKIQKKKIGRGWFPLVDLVQREGGVLSDDYNVSQRSFASL